MILRCKSKVREVSLKERETNKERELERFRTRIPGLGTEIAEGLWKESLQREMKAAATSVYIAGTTE